MENYKKPVIGVICLAVVAAVELTSCASRQSEPVKGKLFVAAPAVLEGERLFALNCYRCHPGGEAGLGPSVNGNPLPQFIKKFQVRHGLGAMPSFDEKEISPKDLKKLGLYLKHWKRY